jgi:hypothetical protein
MGKKSGKNQGKKAAEIQSDADRAIAREATYADRPDQYNPLGSLQWSQEKVRDPATGKMVTKWVQTQNLSDDMQTLFDTDMQGKIQSSQTRQGLLNRAYEGLNTPVNWEQFGQAEGLNFTPDQMRQRAEDMAYQRDMMRLNPQFEQERASLENRLAMQGLSPGDRAYDAAMANFTNSRNDAYERARLGAAGAGREEVAGMWGREVEGNQIANALRDKQIEEYIGQRQYGISEANMVGDGSEFSTASGMLGG